MKNEINAENVTLTSEDLEKVVRFFEILIEIEREKT